jgi:prepilin-type N-terminal cleavage/methylation domain-containing protein
MKNRENQPGSFGNKAFTLIELLVVIAIIAILAAIIMPVLSKAQEKAVRTQCVDNMHELGVAIAMYTNDNRDYLPWINWGTKGPAGWCYHDPLPMMWSQTLLNLKGASGFAKTNVFGLGGGVLYQYVSNIKPFMCPLDGPNSPNPVYRANWFQRTEQLSSYVMNYSAACNNSEVSAADANGALHNYVTAKVTSVFSQECIDLWECDFLNAALYNDGANFPNTEGLGGMHAVGGLVLEICGSTEWMNTNVYNSLSIMPPAGGKNVLWWNAL